MVNGKRRKPPTRTGSSSSGRRKTGIRGKLLNIPKGNPSALKRGSVIRTGLRGRKPLATRIVKQARFSQRTGIAPKTIGFVGRKKKRGRIGGGQVLGFRTDGRLP